MKKTIVDYLEKTTQKFADKISFADDKNQATYVELTQHAQALGTALIKHTEKINKPIAIYIIKNFIKILYQNIRRDKRNLSLLLNFYIC